MHVGMAVIFQNPGAARPDGDVYRDDLHLADLAEPLGFESVWGVEHHFTDYTMCPDVLQFLSYMAGRTQHAQLGSMVVVLPWHDPVRVAEQVAMLDHLSGGRFVFGMGRGLGRVEFDGFRVPMSESRDRFAESARMILAGLEQGYVEFEGVHVRQPRRDIRPRPERTFRGRTFAAAVSPDSLPLIAELGVGILIIPQKPWDVVTTDLAAYRGVYREVNGVDAPAPVTAAWVFCDADPGRARDLARRYMGGYYTSVIEHYEFGSEHFAATKGYEYYGRMSDTVNTRGAEEAIEFFAGLQVWGTPAQCVDRIMDIRDRTGCDTFVGVFGYAGMPVGDAERSMRLFAAEVAPRVREVAAPAQTPAAVG